MRVFGMRELDLSALHEFEPLACNLGDQLGIIWNAQSSRLHHFFQISENVSLAWNGELDSNGLRYSRSFHFFGDEISYTFWR